MINYKRNKINAVVEKNIITGLIISDRFIKDIQAIFQLNLLKIPYVKTISRWCFEYYEKYEQAPKETIQKIYDQNVVNGLDEDEARLIAEFLHHLSTEFDREKTFNHKYILDQAEDYFRSLSLEKLSLDISHLREQGRLEETEALISNYKRITRPSTKGIKVFENHEAINNAFDPNRTYLFRLPGAWGDLVGPIIRGDFIGIFAPPSRGKTFALIEIAIRAVKKGFKVLLASLEMTEPEILRRIYQNVMAESLKPKKIKIPILDCIYNQIGDCKKMRRQGMNKHSVENNIPDDHIPCNVCKKQHNFHPVIYYNDKRTEGINTQAAVEKSKEIKKQIIDNDIALLCFPEGTVTMNEFNAYLDNLEHFDNFIPTFILTDCADYFQPPQGVNEMRHRLDEIWKAHRSLAQQRDCVVITITHTNFETFERDIKPSDASDLKSKIKHLTKAVSLNQTEEEKKQNTMRVSSLKARNEEFFIGDEVVILQQLAIGKFYLDSYRKAPDDSKTNSRGSRKPRKRS